MPTKQWFQVEVAGDEIVIPFLVIFISIQPRFEAVICAY